MALRTLRCRLLAGLLAIAVTAVGIASQIHLHWQGVDPTVRIGSQCGHPEPLSDHACLGCKVTHRTLSAPLQVSSAAEPPVRGTHIQAPTTSLAPAPFHCLSSSRAPPDPFMS